MSERTWLFDYHNAKREFTSWGKSIIFGCVMRDAWKRSQDMRLDIGSWIILTWDSFNSLQPFLDEGLNNLTPLLWNEIGLDGFSIIWNPTPNYASKEMGVIWSIRLRTALWTSSKTESWFGKAWKTTGEDMSNILIVDLERKKLFSSWRILPLEEILDSRSYIWAKNWFQFTLPGSRKFPDCVNFV